jgi:hypothetical protein
MMLMFWNAGANDRAIEGIECPRAQLIVGDTGSSIVRDKGPETLYQLK